MTFLTYIPSLELISCIIFYTNIIGNSSFKTPLTSKLRGLPLSMRHPQISIQFCVKGRNMVNDYMAPFSKRQLRENKSQKKKKNRGGGGLQQFRGRGLRDLWARCELKKGCLTRYIYTAYLGSDVTYRVSKKSRPIFEASYLQKHIS